MFSSTVLEVAIGLVFCYGSVALITSSIYEAISSWLDLRSKTLFTGIKDLLNANDPKNSDSKDSINQKLVLGIYNNALASPLGKGDVTAINDIKVKPSYIDSKHFALALIETIQSIPGDFERLGHDIDAVHDDQIRKLLKGIYDTSGGEIAKIHSGLASWFDAGMDRVSGSYKRWSQFWCFLIAFVLAVSLNIDSFKLFGNLWQHPALVEQISSPVTAEPAIESLKTLPIGWATDTKFEITFVLGWLVTASASLFGGPFWFDILKVLINLRGTGVKPKPEAATDVPVNTERLIIQPKTADSEVLGLRNSIIDLHSARNQKDESYRPIQSEERW